MPIEQRTLVVKGLTDLQKAWKVADKETSRELRKALQDAAEPVRRDAQTLSVVGITNMTPTWARMKTGVTTRSVYVAPKTRETRMRSRKRPRFADLMATRAMQPALNRNVHKVETQVQQALDIVGRKWEQA